MTIDITVDGNGVAVPRSVFTSLLENSVVRNRAPYRDALKSGRISLSELAKLARTADIPYALFFAPAELVDKQLATKMEKLLRAVPDETFTVNSRTRIDIRDVELIVKDLLQKQRTLQAHDQRVKKNPIVGMLRKPLGTVAQEADAIVEAIGLDRSELWELKTGETALERIIGCLESNLILVSRSVRGFMPQLVEVHFSGMTVRHARTPYIFLAGGDHEDQQEPVGRQIFTLVLMTVLVARGIFAPVTYDAQSAEPRSRREYEITGEILMPASEVRKLVLSSLDEVKAAAKRFKVTPTAMTIRAERLGRIGSDDSASYREELNQEFSQRAKSMPRTPHEFTAVRKYAGRELSRRLLDAVDAGRLPASEFCRIVALKKIAPNQLGEFRAKL